MLTVTMLLFLAAPRGGSSEWRWIRPVIDSQVRSLSIAEAGALLSGFCQDLRPIPGEGLKCSTRTETSEAFRDIADNSFHPQGVIYGHFLSPASEDAAVNGWSLETHPLLWGGTLLLTKINGQWRPLWYKSSVITRACRRLRTPTSREVLLCEEEDAGMGAQVHYLFALDLTKPTDIRKALLVTANSFNDGCTIRRQVIKRLNWTEEEKRLRISVATPEWRFLSSPQCDGIVWDPQKRPPALSTLIFELSESGFHPVTPRN